MSKIICEVCGTSYPDTTVQCPICGCVRPGNAKSVAGGNQNEENGGYTYVKGGRFSKSNVKKRSKIAAAGTQAASDSDEKSGNRGLVITAIVLFLAIIAVVCYIIVQFILPGDEKPLPSVPQNVTPAETTTQTEPPTVPCKSLKLEANAITLDKKDAAWMIYTHAEPSDTTDKISFSSSDETVATVTESGKVIAVGPGQAVITVICGEQTAQCTVECIFDLPTEDTTVPEETTLPDVEFVLNRSDITFSSKGDAWMLYSGSLSTSQIVWTTDNAAVATIEGGKVTAVGGGVTTVYGEYNGEKVGCIIRCNFEAAPDGGVSGSGSVFEDGGGVSEDNGSTSTGGTYQLKNMVGGGTDEVTIDVDYSFTMKLVDENGNAVSGVTWTSADNSVCTVSNGMITGVGSGSATVTATYNGNTYTCLVVVK